MRTRPALALPAMLFFSAAQAQLKRVDTLEYAYPMDIVVTATRVPAVDSAWRRTVGGYLSSLCRSR